SGRIELDVVASSRPLASPAADTVIVPRGQTKTVDVLANDAATNPFPGTPLRVIAIRGLGGDSIPAGMAIAPNADNSKLTVTVGTSAQPGDTNIQYQVADATGDQERYVWGTVTVSVQDRPDAPTGVREVSFGDRVVRITWTAAQFNNSPVTGYDVTAVRADTGAVVGTTKCQVTSGCDIPTPGNGPGNAIRISVTATNAIGTSDPGALGSSVWSDILPSAPTITSLAATSDAPAGGSIAVNWAGGSVPAGGSSLVGYTVVIGGVSVDVAADASSYAFSNSGGELSTGVSYPVTVYARNGAQVASQADWNRSAAVAVTTVGPPSQAAGGVSAISDPATGNMQVTWGASDPNGGSTIDYKITRFTEGDAVPAGCPPGGSAGVSSPWTDTTAREGSRYFYVVSASNGLYCTPTVSAVATSLRAPGAAHGSASIQPHGVSGQYDIQAGGSFSVASGTAEKYQYRLNGAAWVDVAPLQWLTSAGDSSVYGTSVTVEFRGCRDSSDNFCGPASSVITRIPVDTRASIQGCMAGGEVAFINPTNFVGAVTVNYKVKYYHPNLGIGNWDAMWTSYSAPAPADATQVVVQATVTATANGINYTDPGQGGPVDCTP
ncbi:MAG: fibronectin type III domain-containing protein, partial [Lacisediminihabitans sp.]